MIFSSFWNQSKFFNFFFSFSISIYIFVKFCVIAWSSSTAKSPLAICGHYYICIRSFSVCLFVCMSICVFVCIAYLAIRLYVYLFIFKYLQVCMSTLLSLHVYGNWLLVYMPIGPLYYPFMYKVTDSQFFSLPVYLSINLLDFGLLVCQPIYLWFCVFL